METHELNIEIRPDGQVRVHVAGAKGPACMDYVRLLQQVMGAEGEIEHTSEYYEPPTGVKIRIREKETG
ncbi:MAG: DUF2997 domain-containing protein [Lentisphaeria bacterium]|nr:DUF2997 domain-containing protein [Lentisphaeria bacterium]